MKLPSHSQVVIIGGGIIGCTVAYHLTKLGWRDIVLLERGQLTCGTTCHAAGLVMQLRATHTLTELCRYGAQLLSTLKDETGQDTGFRRTGSLPIARSPERLIEISRIVSLGKTFGVEAHMLSPREAKERYPLLDEAKIVGGAFIPGDGQTNPVDSAQALAKGARAGGALRKRHRHRISRRRRRHKRHKHYVWIGGLRGCGAVRGDLVARFGQARGGQCPALRFGAYVRAY
jgi:4-methylaminobutanoate oxidase (formaldehyde-forming)